MSKAVGETIGGVALIAAAVVLDIATLGAATPLAAALVTAGLGLIMNGVGTMLSKGPQEGSTTTTRNSVAPWKICYGRARGGGTLLLLESTSEDRS